MDRVRINKYLAESGICSRRKADQLLLQGRVSVNGAKVLSPGDRVDPSEDSVFLDGKPVPGPKKRKIYIALHKPAGVITSSSDPSGRPTVMDLVKEAGSGLHYAGRLDRDTSGLIILTNDGSVSQKITHPRNAVDKRYIVRMAGAPDRRDLETFSNGMEIDGYRTAPCRIKILRKTPRFSLAEVVIHEGRNRQVRRMCARIGHPALELKRVSIGRITLGALKPGAYRRLTAKEKDYLTGLQAPGGP